MRITSIDVMAFIAPVAGYFLFGWRGALLAVLVQTEITWRF